jgi:hypothetical protein
LILDVQPLIDATRELMVTHFGIPSTNAIAEMGTEAYMEFNTDEMPLGLIETVNDAQLGEGSPFAAKDAWMEVELRCWLIRRIDGDTDGEDPAKYLRDTFLRPFADALHADRRMGGIVNRITLSGMGWAANGRWPVMIQPGSGLQAGNVSFRAVLTN